jgi:outer membrane protein OmpA-like peptidoglycan-associated protein
MMKYQSLIIFTIIICLKNDAYCQKAAVMMLEGVWTGKLLRPSDPYSKEWQTYVVFHQTDNQVIGTFKAYRGDIFMEAVLDGTVTSEGLNLTTWNIIDGRRPGTSGYYWCMGYHGILKVIEGGQLYAVLKSYNCRDSILILTRLGESSTDVTSTESRHTDEVIPKQDLTIAQMTEEVKVMEGELDKTLKWNSDYVAQLEGKEKEYKRRPIVKPSHHEPAKENLSREKPSLMAQSTTGNSNRTPAFIIPEAGKNVVLNHVIFREQKSELQPESFGQLDEVVSQMTINPSLRIRLEGHTDRIGSHIMNMNLSKDRAQAVKSYLVGKGVNALRIVAIGYGDSKPICKPKCNANRRVEFKILED